MSERLEVRDTLDALKGEELQMYLPPLAHKAVVVQVDIKASMEQ
jgi:hypothetical protein